MSLDRCAECSDFIDTDVDLECYGNDGDQLPLCPQCRQFDDDYGDIWGRLDRDDDESRVS